MDLSRVKVRIVRDTDSCFVQIFRLNKVGCNGMFEMLVTSRENLPYEVCVSENLSFTGLP